MTRKDVLSLGAGAIGFGCLVAGVALIHPAAGLIVAGVGLLGWSYLLARAN
ncbi:hypothetical protein [Lysobacter enzymogenes]|uniref:hypothetical protein n=1 Tax=Lysobacter enzymogenes TaxID=69 RepID=UPI0019D0D5B2|nr:hypothetical protein [Lysobacter enzymogenes]